MHETLVTRPKWSETDRNARSHLVPVESRAGSSSLTARRQCLRKMAMQMDASLEAAWRQAAEQITFIASELPYKWETRIRSGSEKVCVEKRVALGQIALVVGPKTGESAVAVNVAAAVAAGNRISLALTSEPGTQLRALLKIIRANDLEILDWTEPAADSRWTSLPKNQLVAIVTATHVLVEGRAPARFSLDGGATSRQALVELYSELD